MEDNLIYNKEKGVFVKNDPHKGDMSGLTEILKFALIATIIVLPIRMFIAQPFVVSGTSMVPTFENGEYIIVDEISYELGNIKRGDVAIFKYPEDPKKYFIKRVIGLPGETINVDGEIVTIINKENPDGFQFEEPYVKNKGGVNTTITLGEDQFFVMGDNRAASFDSRYWGALDAKYLVGRAYLRLLPIKDLDYLPGYFKL